MNHSDVLQYYRNLRHHRQYVLEGIRRVALRNLDVFHDTMGDLGLNRLTREQDIIAVQDHILAIQGVPADAVTRSIMGFILWLPWQIYLCLLYAEVESYQKTSVSLKAIRHPEFSNFLRRHSTAVDSLKEMRHKILHPQRELSLEYVQSTFMDCAALSIGHYYIFVFELQAYLDAFIAWLMAKSRTIVIAECDAMKLPSNPSDADVRRAQAELNRLKRNAPLWAYFPIWSSESELRSNRMLTPVQHLFWRSVLNYYHGLNENQKQSEHPHYVRRAATGMWWNMLQLIVLTAEIFANATITDGSILLETTAEASTKPSAYSPQEIALRRQKTLMGATLARVSAALLLEPIRIYQDAVQKTPSCRQAAIDRLLPSESVLSDLRCDRNIVFHVAYSEIDPRSHDESFSPLLDGVDWLKLIRCLIKWNPPS